MKHIRRITYALIACVTLTLCTAFVPNANAQSEYSVRRAHNLLKSNGDYILGYAHMSATYNSCTTYREYDIRGGFGIQMRIHFNSIWGSQGYSDIHFFFDNDGKLQSIGDGQANDGFPAFAFSGLVLETLRFAALQDEELDAVSRQIIKNIPDTKTLLLYTLQLRQLVN